MRVHRDVQKEDQGDGTWSVLLRDTPVRRDLTREEAVNWSTKTPSELVKDTPWAHQWFARGHAAERIAGVRAEDVCDPIRSGEYTLDLFDLYDRMWDLAQDLGDGTRRFRPRPGSREALKWLIEELSGTPADPVKKMPDNDHIRRTVHARLEERGWAERINQVSFLLLRDPDGEWVPTEGRLTSLRSHAWWMEPAETTPATESPSVNQDSDENGATIVDVAADELLTDDGVLGLGGFVWSDWHSLDDAAREATTSSGVYVARSGPDIVYVGMAGERRGIGVRGRLQIYSRGRGAVSGLGEAALDRALADPVWLTNRLTQLREEGPARAKSWAVDAMHRANLLVCWTAAPEAETARTWETQVMQELEDVALWNRARPRAAPADGP